MFGDPWTIRSITQAIADIRLRSGLPDDVVLHGLRHTFATNAITNGVDVATLAQLLGHSNIATTQRYVHLAGKTDHLNAAMALAIHQVTKPAPKKSTKPKGESA